uniref:Uncharacterized protein n=1 Tax=Medicago truncatula TaxID=3880 RepID=A2Q6H7_MEDTR|nr:hypothetical protein MtrDRAFT_AC184047g10v2 [Medicago truncatula]
MEVMTFTTSHDCPLSTTPNKLCEGCLLEKQFKAIFLKDSSSRSKMLLELIHANVYGPSKLSSLDKKHTYSFSSKTFQEKMVYLLIQKSLLPSRSSKMVWRMKVVGR